MTNVDQTHVPSQTGITTWSKDTRNSEKARINDIGGPIRCTNTKSLNLILSPIHYKGTGNANMYVCAKYVTSPHSPDVTKVKECLCP